MFVCHYNFQGCFTARADVPLLFGTDGDEFVRSNKLKGLLLLTTLFFFSFLCELQIGVELKLSFSLLMVSLCYCHLEDRKT